MMETVELGEFVKRRIFSGQPVSKHKNYYYFLLLEKFHYAGTFYWKDKKIEEGIGLNPHIVENIPLRKLIIESRDDEKYYLLDSWEEAKNNCGKDTQKGTTLIVLPLFAFKEVKVLDEENIIRSKALKV